MEEKDYKITAIIKTRNSESTLYNTLESIKEFDEIYIIDENSTDDTVEIAKEYKAKIIYAVKGEILTAANQILKESVGDWIFFIKDNEIIPQKLIYEIKKYIENPKKNKNALCIPLKTFYFGKEIKSLSKNKILRIFKKGVCEFTNDYSLNIKLKIGKAQKINPNFRLKNAYILSYYENDISKNIVHILETNKINLKSIKPESFSVFAKPFFAFFVYYFIKGGILDGKYGYILSVQKFIEKFCEQIMIMNKKFKGENDDI